MWVSWGEMMHWLNVSRLHPEVGAEDLWSVCGLYCAQTHLRVHCPGPIVLLCLHFPDKLIQVETGGTSNCPHSPCICSCFPSFTQFVTEHIPPPLWGQSSFLQSFLSKSSLSDKANTFLITWVSHHMRSLDPPCPLKISDHGKFVFKFKFALYIPLY